MSWGINLDELTKAINAETINVHEKEFTGVSTDTRKENKGLVFFALKGDTYDAHNFLKEAVQSGASALVVHQNVSIEIFKSTPVTILKVTDTLKALQDLSKYWRKKMGCKVVAITGSNGKTTTKEFAATVISEKYKVQYSKGSFNNHFGVPLSLLSLEPQHEVGIFEVGMNHPGELKELTKILNPDVAVITTVGRAHLEGLGSLQAVAEAKEELFAHSPNQCIRVINLDNPYTKKMMERVPGEATTISFSSFETQADVYLKEVLSTIDFMEISGRIRNEPGRVKLSIFGRQNLNNLMAAASLALAVGVEPDRIWTGLSKCKTNWGRNQVFKHSSGAKIIFDAYNANPDSMQALIENVSRLSVSGKKIAILGEMLEMGSFAEELHYELGKKAGESNFDYIWFVGPHKDDFEKGVKASGFSKTLVVSGSYEQELATQLSSVLDSGDVAFIKGSRGIRLEQVMKAWGLETDLGKKV